MSATDNAARLSTTPERPALAQVPDAVWTILIAAILIGGLEISARNEWVSTFILPAPSAVVGALIDGFRRGVYLTELSSTLSSAAAGFGLSFILSMTVAGCLASISKLERIVYPFIVAFQTLPKVSIAPLIIIWIGFGETSKIVIVAITCFFPMLVNNLQGFKIRDRNHQELFKSLGAGRLQTFRHLRLPSALPFIFAGLKISTIFALIGAIVAEFVGSQNGIGRLLLYEKSAFNIPGVFAVLVLLMIVGVIIHLCMAWLERRLMFWASEAPASAH